MLATNTYMIRIITLQVLISMFIHFHLIEHFVIQWCIILFNAYIFFAIFYSISARDSVFFFFFFFLGGGGGGYSAYANHGLRYQNAWTCMIAVLFYSYRSSKQKATIYYMPEIYHSYDLNRIHNAFTSIVNRGINLLIVFYDVNYTRCRGILLFAFACISSGFSLFKLRFL